MTLNRDVVKPPVTALAEVELRRLTAQQVRGALGMLARDHSSRTVVLAHNALRRAIQFVYRKEIRPVLVRGAEVMDQILAETS